VYANPHLPYQKAQAVNYAALEAQNLRAATFAILKSRKSKIKQG
jgi:hypothetical protein